MPADDPRNPYRRAQAALNEQIDLLRENSLPAGADAVSRLRRQRHAVDIAALIEMSDRAAHLASEEHASTDEQSTG